MYIARPLSYIVAFYLIYGFIYIGYLFRPVVSINPRDEL